MSFRMRTTWLLLGITGLVLLVCALWPAPQGLQLPSVESARAPEGHASQPPAGATPTAPSVAPFAASSLGSVPPSVLPTQVAAAHVDDAGSAFARAMGVTVGSEGWGTHLQAVLDRGTPAQALAAARLLAHCEGLDTTLNALHGAKGAMPTDIAKPWIEQAPEQAAQGLSLARRAMLGQVPEAAAFYAERLPPGAQAAALAEARTALQAAASQGDESALYLLALHGQRFGLTDLERAVYATLFQQRHPPGREVVPGIPFSGRLDPARLPPLSEAQWAQAASQAQQVLAQSVARKP
jgi:hypothetical protein